MKKIYLLLIPVLIIFFAGLFSSCDYLLPAPLGRNNPYDTEAQIGRFNAAPSGSNSIVTTWDWHDALPVIDDNRVIDKIRIVHGEGSRPTGLGLLFDKNVQEFTSTSSWQVEWTGLNQNNDQYFALYSHEKGGLWLSPKYIKYFLDTSIPDNNVSLISNSPSTNSTEFIVYEFTSTPTTSDVTSTAYDWTPGDFLILEFDIHQAIYFDQFLLHLENDVQLLNLSFYALKKDISNISTIWADMISDSTIDYDFMLTCQITSLNDVIDISDVINRESLYYAHSIVVTTDTFVNVNIGNWVVDAHFWGNN